MEPKTLKALKGSIEKWVDIERSCEALDNGGENCSLCKLFTPEGYNFPDCPKCPKCPKCPVKNCYRSPFKAWMLHHDEKHSPLNRHLHKWCKE